MNKSALHSRFMLGLFRLGEVALILGLSAAHAEPLAVLDRYGAYVSVEPYAANVVRVTISDERELAADKPGYGFIAHSDPKGWTHTTSQAGDRFVAAGVTVEIAPQKWPGPPDQLERYFVPSLPPVSITLRGPDGEVLTQMNGWEMAPHVVAGEKTFRVGATFGATPDEHYYGLGQNQEGVLDLRGRTIDCRHNYDAPGRRDGVRAVHGHQPRLWHRLGQSVRHAPFRRGLTVDPLAVRSRRARLLLRHHRHHHRRSLRGLSRVLTGATPLPPKAAFGLIQCKARYESQEELLGVAKGYRSRGYPLDVMVLDWFYWTRMGQLDIDPELFPRPRRHEQDSSTIRACTAIISVWPRFEKESRYFNFLAEQGLAAEGQGRQCRRRPAVRTDRAGALIDSTNPEARAWFWGKIRDNIASQGFDWFWLDETEPDLVPDGYFYSIGSGDRYHNLFPLLHIEGVAEGSRRDRPDYAQPDPRARRLSRRAAQRRAVLVLGRPGDLGGAAPPDPHGPRLHRHAASPIGATTSAAGSAAGGAQGRASRCCSIRPARRDGSAGMTTIRNCSRAGSQYSTFTADPAHPRRPQAHRDLGIMASRPSPCSPSSCGCATPDPLSLFAGPPDL